jgi:hypothetical protein
LKERVGEIMELIEFKKSEKGFALVLALVFMLAMTIIGVSVITNMSTEMHIAGNERDAKLAFQVSESGLQEAFGRIHLTKTSALYVGEIDTDAGYRTSAWTKSFTSSEAGLNYTVTLEYLLEDDVLVDESHPFYDSNTVANTLLNTTIPPSPGVKNGEIVYFGQDFNIDATTTSLTIGQFPVYKITSVGSVGGSNTTRTIVAYVGSSNLDLDTGYAIDTNSCMTINGGSFEIDGLTNQDAACGTCETLLDSTPGEGCVAKAADDDLDTYLGLPLSEVKSMSDEVHYCLGAPNCSDVNDDIPNSGQLDAIVQDWGDFAGDTYGSYIYIDNPGNEVVLTGDFEGRGLLVVNGDLRINGGFDYEGLVYVYGTLTLGGGGNSVNITGGLVADDTVTFNGTIDVDYDKETLEDVSRQNKSQALLLWKRQ